jgi:hypothetical protein
VCTAAKIGKHWTPRELRHSFVSLTGFLNLLTPVGGHGLALPQRFGDFA